MKNWQIITGGITAPKGFMASGISAGIKKSKNKDLAIVFSSQPCVAAGVFTRNVVKAAPLVLNEKHLAQSKGQAQAIVVNSGNANACTGEQGMNDALAMARLTGEKLGIKTEQVLVASTGVIGMPLPMEEISQGIGVAIETLSATGGKDAAQAIMTTDLVAKEIAVELTLDGQPIRIGAMAKGSGMIHPNMATMLGFITTDAAVEKEALAMALKTAVEDSFNMLTVDGDTSTNDLVLVLANGQGGTKPLTLEDEEYKVFLQALTFVCIHLAKEIAKDGEGATKFLEVRITNARNKEDARLAAKAIASSSLVKTALFGGDANWGRILCAAGYSGAQFDPNKVDIFLESSAGRIQTAREGAGIPFDEEMGARILKEQEIIFLVDLHEGNGDATAYTCDFSYDYVRINADYRT